MSTHDCIDSERAHTARPALCTPESHVAVLRAAEELAARWLAAAPAIARSLGANDRIALEVMLVPAPGISLVLTDGEGTRFALITQEYGSATLH